MLNFDDSVAYPINCNLMLSNNKINTNVFFCLDQQKLYKLLRNDFLTCTTQKSAEFQSVPVTVEAEADAFTYIFPISVSTSIHKKFYTRFSV